MQVRGGGIVNINHSTKRIVTFGKSGGFGAPNIEEVKFLLAKAFPDYERDIKVTNYVRG